MYILRLFLAALLLPGLAVAQQHVSFRLKTEASSMPTCTEAAIAASCWRMEAASPRKVGRNKCPLF
jgi:hypothetical protein